MSLISPTKYRTNDCFTASLRKKERIVYTQYVVYEVICVARLIDENANTCIFNLSKYSVMSRPDTDTLKKGVMPVAVPQRKGCARLLTAIFGQFHTCK